MRKYAYLKQPIQCNDHDYVYKIMFNQTDNNGVTLYYYCSKDATQYSFSEYFDYIEDIYDDWNECVDENGWIDLNNETSGC